MKKLFFTAKTRRHESKGLNLVALCLGGFLFFVLISPTVFAADQKASAFDRVMRTGTIKCAYILIPPETTKDLNTGQLSELAYDIAQEVGRRLNLKIEWAEEVGFQTLAAGLETGRYDAVCFSLYRYSIAAPKVDYSIPLFYSSTGIFVRADDRRFDGRAEALNNPDITIATIDSKMSQFIAAEDFPKAKTLSMPQMTDMPQMMLAVESGKADVALVNGLVAEGYLKANPGKLKNIAIESPVRIFSHGFAFAKEQYDLVKMIDITLEEMHDHGFIQKILDRYDLTAKTYIRAAKPYERYP